MRPDGTRAKNLSAIVQAIPHIMPKRYDAQNWSSEQVDDDILRAYIREKRKEDKTVTRMSILAAAYYKAVLANPNLNRFVMNRKIYDRNHFCFSFVILKTRADGTPDEACLKVFLQPEDTVFTISEKVKKLIAENQEATHNNSTDKFVNFAFSIPGLARFVFALAYRLDQWGLLPRKIIDLSPFHTSLFITNLASINTPSIHHHCYEFGTTSVFVSMGRPTRQGDGVGKQMPISVVMDERIATGVEYSRFFAAFLRYLRNPAVLEGRLDGEDEETGAACLAQV